MLGGRAEWRRLWVVLVPGLVYAAWFIWARKFGQGDVTIESISSVFAGSADQVAAIVASITGLFRVPGNFGLPVVLELRSDWGYPLAGVSVALVALHVRRAPRSIYFWTLVVTLVLSLVLPSPSASVQRRTPFASRYVYMGGIVSLLLVAELGREIRWSTVTGLLAGRSCLRRWRTPRRCAPAWRLFQAEGETNRATLAALEIARHEVDRGLPAEDGEKTTHSHPDMFFPIWAYFELAHDEGSPAYSLSELEATGEQAREAADQELVRTLHVEVVPTPTPEVDRHGVLPCNRAKATVRLAPPAPASRSCRNTAAPPLFNSNFRPAASATARVQMPG